MPERGRRKELVLGVDAARAGRALRKVAATTANGKGTALGTRALGAATRRGDDDDNDEASAASSGVATTRDSGRVNDTRRAMRQRTQSCRNVGSGLQVRRGLLGQRDQGQMNETVYTSHSENSLCGLCVACCLEPICGRCLTPYAC